jgi:hypothetical protein
MLDCVHPVADALMVEAAQHEADKELVSPLPRAVVCGPASIHAALFEDSYVSHVPLSITVVSIRKTPVAVLPLGSVVG